MVTTSVLVINFIMCDRENESCMVIAFLSFQTREGHFYGLYLVSERALYLIQEKPNSHFVSHTICFMVKYQSSVTFKGLLHIHIVDKVSILQFLKILTMMKWVLESRWKRKARNSVIPTIPANLYYILFYSSVTFLCLNKIQKLTYDGCCVLLTEAPSPDAGAPWAWSPCAASAACVSLALESLASDIKLLTFTCHHSHEGRYF